MEYPLEKNKELKGLTTFGISCIAKYFSTFSSISELQAILKSELYRSENSLVLGGGSNVLFMQDFNGMVLLNTLKGVEVKNINEELVHLELASGEVWHEVVEFAVNNNYGGIENLSLIPGSVGAAPMQNIGAYGKELKDVFVSLKAVEVTTGELKEFTKDECAFGYRESVFKRALKNKYIIVSVTLALSRANHQLNTDYGAINQELETLGLEPTIQNVSKCVIAIRRRKLPDPKEIGNSGSFFKNPVVPPSLFQKLAKEYPEIPNYPAPENYVKLAAGWLIEKAGWKGKRIGDYGVHKNQALVLVNYGEAKGEEVYGLSQDILDDVKAKFGVELEREVNII